MKGYINKMLISRLKTGAVFFILFLICNCLFSQRALNPVKSSFDDIEGLLGTAKNKINKVTVQSESGLTLDLNCEYTGFTEKKYSLKVEILNKSKMQLKEIMPVISELNSRANSIDFSLQFKPLPSQIYQTNTIESSFLKMTILEEGSELDKLLGDGMNNRTYVFDCKKDWTIKTIANNNTIVEIQLIPLSSVSKMRPSN
jgi:hypothetical protein